MGLVDFTVEDGVGHIRLNRPDVANAFDLATARAFSDAVSSAGADASVRAVLVTGAGKRFCAGGDARTFTGQDASADILELATELDQACQALAALAKPVVAAVQGAVAGAGLAVMLSCDVIVAEPSTKFAFAYPGVGLTPDCGVSWLLPRAVGQQRALAFALSGKALTAGDALVWGLVTEVVDEAAERACDLARGLAAGPAAALGQARRLFRAGWELGRGETGAEEARTISRMVSGEEAQALIRQFTSR